MHGAMECVFAGARMVMVSQPGLYTNSEAVSLFTISMKEKIVPARMP